MSLIQIPLEPPPKDTRPEQGDLFEPQSWETAYREMHDFPTLLMEVTEARDELARSRKREAFWISLIAHIVLILLIVNSPKFEKYLPHRAVMMVHSVRDNSLTFLELPPDAQKVTPPKSSVMSDKNRIATSRAPKLDRQELKKILDASRQGRPGPAAPPQQQTPAQAAQAQPPQPLQAQVQQNQPPPPPATTARLQAPPVAHKSVFSTEPMSASRAIDQAAHDVATNHGRYGAGDAGDLGLGQRQPTARVGPAEILSDTMGVDFGPYLQRVLHDVKEHWYEVIPESAMPPLLKKGKLSIEFSILKNGNVAGLAYVSSSGDVALDRAAYGGISSSDPFPPLPREFSGQALRLRFTFFYNPDRNEAADLQ